MPHRKMMRRFEPRYGVSATMIEEESKWLAREIEDHEHLSAKDIDTKTSARHNLCKQKWEELQLLIRSLPERGERNIQCLLFRDIYHVLELYLCHIRKVHPEAATPGPPPRPRNADAEPFTEWLFGP